MVVSLVRGTWNIDGHGVSVVEGAVYSFANEADALYLMTVHENEFGAEDGPPRAVPVAVQKGTVVSFWRDSDAQYFVDRGKARWLSETEVQALFAGDQPGNQPHIKDEPAYSAPVVDSVGNVLEQTRDEQETSSPQAPRKGKRAKA